MSDFDHSFRKQAWWSGDSRRAASGHANEVILQKLDLMEVKDLSDNEAVQMGHVMEPVIGRLAEQKLGVQLTKIEEFRTHPKESWLRSHFDFAGVENGETILVECKNYNAAVRSKFDSEAGIVPAADMAQLVHEAAVFGVRKIYLAVLFGGQEFFLAPFAISDEQKDDLVKQMAKFWAAVQTRTPLPPESTEEAKLMFPTAVPDTTVLADSTLEELATQLFRINHERKQLETAEDKLKAKIQERMGNKAALVDIAGNVLATWKNDKASMKFDQKLFQQAMPDIYKQFVRQVDGPRKFLIK
jgi:predicted phage-related endonuclease